MSLLALVLFLLAFQPELAVQVYSIFPDKGWFGDLVLVIPNCSLDNNLTVVDSRELIRTVLYTLVRTVGIFLLVVSFFQRKPCSDHDTASQ